MAYKLIEATAVRNGTVIVIEGAPCTVKKYDVSKTGKHGHSKVRIEAVGVLDGKKRVIVKPGHEKFEVPLINKKKGQVLSVNGDEASVMDLESFETMNIPISEDLKESVKSEAQVEYWEVDGAKVIKRVF